MEEGDSNSYYLPQGLGPSTDAYPLQGSHTQRSASSGDSISPGLIRNTALDRAEPGSAQGTEEAGLLEPRPQ